MNTIYHKNLTAIKKYYPDMLKSFLKCNDKAYHILFSNNNQGPNLIFQHNGEKKFFYDISSDPLLHVQKVFQKMGLEKAPFAVLCGMGLGYQLLFLYRMLCDKGPLSRIICIEKDLACFLKAMTVFDFTEVLADARVKLIVGSSRENLFVACQSFFDDTCYKFSKALRFIPWPASVAMDEEYYQSAKNAIKDVVSRWLSQRGNDSYDTLVAYENFFNNLENYSHNPNIYCVKDLFPKRPAIVVATGPSLNKNVHELSAVNRRAVILSVDASLSILHRNGIIPHFVTSIERTPGLEKFFRGLSHMEKTVHVVPSFAYPTTVSAYKGPKLFMTRPYAFFESLGMRHDMFDMGISTAIAAFETARLLGCDPIILMGNDLATAPGGKTHAQGCSFGQQQQKFSEQTFPVPGNLGGTVETCQIWYQNIKDYESRIAAFGGSVVNATEGGAKIHGTRIMSLKRAIQDYCRNDFDPRNQVLAKVRQSTNQTAFDFMYAPMAKMIKQSEDAIALCQKGVSLSRPMLITLEKRKESLSTSLIHSLHALLDDIDEILAKTSASDLIVAAQEFFYPESIPLFLEWQVAKERFSDPDWGDAYRLKLADEFFGTYGMLCTSLNYMLKDGMKRLDNLISQKNNTYWK